MPIDVDDDTGTVIVINPSLPDNSANIKFGIAIKKIQEVDSYDSIQTFYNYYYYIIIYYYCYYIIIIIIFEHV